MVPSCLAVPTFTVTTSARCNPPIEQLIRSLRLDVVNPRLATWQGFRRPGEEYVVPERTDVRIFTLDEPWASTAGVTERLHALGGYPVSPAVLLCLLYGRRELIKTFPLLVALTGPLLNENGRECYLNLWNDEPTNQTGLGLLPEEQEWRRGDCFPYQLPDTYRLA